ncbi:MAG: IPTL-CTERM sorting domain-containing protein [Chitinophagales bacterium]
MQNLNQVSNFSQEPKSPINIFVRLFLFSMLFSFFHTEINAQVVSDNVIHNNANGLALPNGSSISLSNFVVPAGNDKLLLYGIILANDFGQTPVIVRYGTTDLIAAPGNPFEFDLNNGPIPSSSYFYYLPLGDLASDLTEDITVNISSAVTGRHVLASTYSGVNQSNPLDGQMGNDIVNDGTSSILNISTNPGDMVVDLIVASDNPTTYDEGPEQELLHANLNLGNDSKLTVQESICKTTTMSWTLDGANIGAGHYAININAAQTGTVANACAPPVPTLSEWGLIILALLLLTLGTLYLLQPSVRSSLEQEG